MAEAVLGLGSPGIDALRQAVCGDIARLDGLIVKFEQIFDRLAVEQRGEAIIAVVNWTEAARLAGAGCVIAGAERDQSRRNRQSWQ